MQQEDKGIKSYLRTLGIILALPLMVRVATTYFTGMAWEEVVDIILMGMFAAGAVIIATTVIKKRRNEIKSRGTSK